MKDAVVFIAMTYPKWTTLHLAKLGVELYKKIPAGIEYYIVGGARNADPGAWEVILERVPPSNRIEAETVRCAVGKVLALAQKYRKVLVHTGGGWGQTRDFVLGLRSLPQSQRKKIRFVATTHSFRLTSIFFVRFGVNLIQSLLYLLFYDMVIFQCYYTFREFFGARILRFCRKSTIVPLGCEKFEELDGKIPESVQKVPELANVIQDVTTFKFIYLAGYRQGKNHAWLVRNLSPVLRARPNARLILCGNPNGPYYNEVRTLVCSLGLSHQILVQGKIPRADIPWVLSHCQCAVVPSSSETFGHCFLEPMFAGIPVLGTRVGIAEDIITDGETGFLIDTGDPVRLQEYATRLAENPEMARKMGRYARNMVELSYTHNAVACRLVDVYKSVLN